MLGESAPAEWCPDWYPLFAAAKELHVAPWELAQRSSYYMHRGLEMRAAEAAAQAQSDRHELVGGSL